MYSVFIFSCLFFFVKVDRFCFKACDSKRRAGSGESLWVSCFSATASVLSHRLVSVTIDKKIRHLPLSLNKNRTVNEIKCQSLTGLMELQNLCFVIFHIKDPEKEQLSSGSYFEIAVWISLTYKLQLVFILGQSRDDKQPVLRLNKCNGLKMVIICFFLFCLFVFFTWSR